MKNDLARLLSGARYSDLMEIAEELSGMIVPDVRPQVTTPAEFAALLYDWAEATVSDQPQTKAA
jgi:hypothetical protein